MSKIILYGVGLQGEKFYWANKGRYDIPYCIDENGQKSFHGLSVFSLEEVLDDVRGKLIVIAAEYEKYEAISRMLTKAGLAQDVDFIWMGNMGKATVVLYGNCHMWALNNYLCQNPYFADRYSVVIINVFSPWLEAYDEVLQNCKVLISQDVRENNSAGAYSAKQMEEKTRGCVCLRIPNLFGFSSLYPQASAVHAGIRHMHHLADDAVSINPDDERDPVKREEIRIEKAVISHMAYRDDNIDQLYKGGCSLKEISESIRYGDVYQNVAEHFASDIEKIRKRDGLCDVKISDFILQNYKKVQLFYDQYHPTNAAVKEMGRQILSLLKLPVFEEIPMTWVMDASEVFIYGCVKKQLGMQFTQKFIRCNKRHYTLWNLPLDIDAYIKQYIIWNYGSEI